MLNKRSIDVVTLGLDQRLLLPRWINELGFLLSSPLGVRGSAYIVLPNECGPSDQTDINRTVFLNALGRWSMTARWKVIGPHTRAGAQGGRALPPGPLGLPLVPVASGLF